MAIDTSYLRLALGGAYEGASRIDSAIAHWLPPLGDPDEEVLSYRSTLDARAFDLARNDGYVRSAIDIHRDSIIGSFYRLQARPQWRVLGLDEQWASEFQEEVEEKFHLWAEAPAAWADAKGMDTFTGLLRIAVGAYLLSGEVIALVEWIRGEGRPYNTALRLVDVTRLRTPWNKTADQDIRDGVEVTPYGRPVALHIVRNPRDPYGSTQRIPLFLPTGRPRAIFLRESVRPEQTRGVANLVSALRATKLASKFRDIELQAAVVAASFVAAIESELPADAVYASLGAGNANKAIVDYATSYLSAVGQYAAGGKNLHIDGIKIPHLFPGTKLKMIPPSSPGGVGQEFEASLLRHTAAALGVPYEALARDWSRSNYSSARMAAQEAWRHMQARKKLVADRLASLTYRAWLEEAYNRAPNRGGLETLQGRRKPDFYDPVQREALTKCDWIGASRGQVDELKETQAAVLRMRYGLTTQRQELERLGLDWRDALEQQAREAQMREELGLQFEHERQDNSFTGDVRDVEDISGRTPGGDEGDEDVDPAQNS